MAEVLKEPDRKLNLWQFEYSESPTAKSELLKIIGLKQVYSTSDAVEVQIMVDDPFFNCGDLYITIFDVSTIYKQVITQSGYFGQCFENNNSILPVDDVFSEVIQTPGEFEIIVEVNDKRQTHTISTNAKFAVK